MFCSVVETFTSILFIHFVQGTLDLSTDGSKVIISENVTLTCKDILKSRSVLILYKSNSDPAFNTIVNCPFGAPLCSVNGGAKYGYQKDLSHADYNEFKVILKNFSDAFYGDYKCQDFDVATSYDELPIPYTANLEDKCSNIITCSDPNAECLKSTSVCACKPGCIEVNGKCTGPTTSTAEPTTTIPTSTTAPITTTATSTYVQTTSPTSAVPITASSTMAAPITASPTTLVPITASPTTVVPTRASSTTAAPITALPTRVVPITSSSTTVAPITSSATITVTSATPTASSSSTNNQPQKPNFKEEEYIIGGCVGGAVVVILLIIGIIFCLRRWPVCKCWRSEKLNETFMDPYRKHIPAKHLQHGGNSQARKQYDWPQKSRTADQSFPNHYNNPAYVGPAGKRKGTSRYLDYSSNLPSYTFHDPFSGEYFRTADQSRGHHVGQRYAPYPQSQQRGRMQQAWFQPYRSGRLGFYDYSGNWDIYY